jgi:hypothetical protein
MVSSAQCAPLVKLRAHKGGVADRAGALLRTEEKGVDVDWSGSRVISECIGVFSSTKAQLACSRSMGRILRGHFGYTTVVSTPSRRSSPSIVVDGESGGMNCSRENGVTIAPTCFQHFRHLLILRSCRGPSRWRSNLLAGRRRASVCEHSMQRLCSIRIGYV